MTQDLPVSLGSSTAIGDTSSSPSTRYTDSPFSHSSTPSSASSHSPGPAAMLRTISSSPSRPPVTRKRTGSLASVECSSDLVGLDPVRESTTSTSSDSTIRANDRSRSRSTSKSSESTQPQTPPIPQGTAPFPSKSPKLAPSPHLVSSKRSASPALHTARPRWGVAASVASSHPTKQGVAGLGVSIPGTIASGTGSLVTRPRSRSISSSFSQPRSRKDVATPPLPSLGLASPPKSQRTVQRAVSHGLTYHTMPPLKGSSSRSAAVQDGNMSTTSPAKITTPAIVKPGFFSRGRTKSEEKQPEKQPEKVIRRGPTAGTGYEGYGTFGKASRGRTGSTSNSSTRGSSGSQTSTTSTISSTSGSRPGSEASVDMDDYFMERLKPVVIVGGEVVENYNRPVDMVRSGSSPAVMESRPNSRQDKPETARSGSSLAVFSRGGSPVNGLGDSDGGTVASRRANIPGRSVTPIPPPINTSGYRIRPAPSPASSMTSVGSSRKQSFDTQDATPASSKPKSRWNFFQKSQPKIAASTPVLPPAVSPPPAPSVPMIPRSRSTSGPRVPAHYALLDQEEQLEAQELVERMHELRQKRVESNEAPVSTASYTHVLRKKQSIHLADPVKPSSASPPIGKSLQSILLPPYRDQAHRAKDLMRQAKTEEKRAVRQREDAPRSAPLEATSTKGLPRVRTELPQSTSGQGWSAPPRVEPALSRLFQAPPSANREEFQVNWNSHGLTPTAAPSGQDKIKDFLEYDPLDIRGRRLASPPILIEEPTPMSTNPPEWPVRGDSISKQSVVEPPIDGDDETKPESPVVAVEEQEEPSEDFYSELEGLYGFSQQPPTPATTTFAAAVAPSLKRSDTMKSTTSSLGSPFQYADLCSPLQFKFDSPKVEQELDYDDEENDLQSGIFSLDSPTLPPTLPAKPVPESIPIISRSSLLGPDQPLPFTPPAQSGLPPATPFSISSFIRYYGETDSQRGNSVIEPLTHQLDSPENNSSKSHKSTGSNASCISTTSLSAAEDEMKIRPWALIASRWLSFDRVLVSPAHQTLSNGNSGRVLVVDGLGTGMHFPSHSISLSLTNIASDDWSFYCALSYPDAKVYNLSQALSSAAKPTPASPSVPRPTNHHQIHYPNFATSFPFPKGFFNVICFRFLPSSSDSHWPFILSECKRVLQYGGYLEVTLLDAELMNVGSRAQRAVDLVKAIMQRENESSSSPGKPASEKVLRILAKKGFEDINKCFLGLPAVGKVDSRSEREQGAREPSPDDPDSISEVISKVGRWWYSRCYEGVITSQGEHMGRSMWADKGLLRECKKKRTNFRMLVCCARKPEAKRGSINVSEGLKRESSGVRGE